MNLLALDLHLQAVKTHQSILCNHGNPLLFGLQLVLVCCIHARTVFLGHLDTVIPLHFGELVGLVAFEPPL